MRFARLLDGLMRETKRDSAGSLYKSYFRTLYLSRMSWAVFWLVFVYFLIWSLPWVPGGLSIDDYTPEFVTTIAFAASCLAVGLAAGAFRGTLRRKRETLLAWTSLYDETTGLYNRRYFYDRLSLECERSRRHGLSFVLLLLQIAGADDGGDENAGFLPASALKSAAAAVKNATRTTDVVGLMGKREFAVVLLGVSSDQAQKVAEKVKASLEERLPNLAASSGLKALPLVRIGVSTYGPDGDSPDMLVESARSALEGQTGLPPLCRAAS